MGSKRADYCADIQVEFADKLLFAKANKFDSYINQGLSVEFVNLLSFPEGQPGF